MIDSMTPAAFREAVRQKARDYQDAERELCAMLAAVDGARLWRAWGYSSLAHYAEDELELTHRKALELIRVATSLKALPELDRAFRQKGVSFSKIREATRVATPGTDADWARTVQERPYREVERAVFAHRREETITLRVDLAPEEYERLERAFEAVRRRQGRDASPGVCLDVLATAFLTSPGQAEPASRFPAAGGTAPFTQVVYRCEGCSRAEVETRRGRAPVSPNGLAQAACDAVVLREARRARRVVPRALARAAWTRSIGRCERCGQRGWLHLHHRQPVSEGGVHSLENLRLLCSACHGAEHRARQPGLLSASTGAAGARRDTAATACHTRAGTKATESARSAKPASQRPSASHDGAGGTQAPPSEEPDSRSRPGHTRAGTRQPVALRAEVPR